MPTLRSRPELVRALVLFLVAFAGAVVLLAMENQQPVTLTFFEYSVTTTMAVVAGVTYVLGMLSGWTIVGMLWRSLSRVTQEPAPGERAHAR